VGRAFWLTESGLVSRLQTSHVKGEVCAAIAYHPLRQEIKGFASITDNDGCVFLAQQPGIDEVNFLPRMK